MAELVQADNVCWIEADAATYPMDFASVELMVTPPPTDCISAVARAVLLQELFAKTNEIGLANVRRGR
jgi:hypothetical protein